jgi:hypothetical protein
VMLTTMWWLQNLEETVNKKKECERLMWRDLMSISHVLLLSHDLAWCVLY